MMKVKLNFNNLKKISKNFSEIIPSNENNTGISIPTKSSEILSDISKVNLKLSTEEYLISKKSGSDLYLTPEKRKMMESPGFFFNDVNDNIDLELNSYKGWKLQYLKNMLLLQDYNNIFRDFLQSCALSDVEGLNLTCESRFQKFVSASLLPIVNKGYNLEIESLKILHKYKILRIELYKNLKVERNDNKDYRKYEFIKYPTPLAPLVIAHEIGNDHSIAKDQKPFILATTMLVTTPMKMAIFNQNLKKKLHGLPDKDEIDYVVRFESQFNYSDFTWILPTQNKPKRLRSTKITDFNNIMRGNPYFTSQFDLIDPSLRYTYMSQNPNADISVLDFITQTYTY